MKTVFKSLVLIAAAAFALNSCSKNDAANSVKPENMVTLKFRINNADEATVSKALLGTENGKNFLNWEDGDQIGTFSVGTFGQDAASNNNPGTVEVDDNGYTLNVQTFKTGTITDIYSYYPYSASAGKVKTAAIMTIPESQTMNELGFNADAMPMVGEPVSVDLTTTAQNTDTPCGDIRFSNLGSIIQFNVYSSVATEETITSVKYIGDGIGGSFTIDLTAIDLSSANIEDLLTLTAVENGTVGEITTSYTTHPAIPTGKANAIPVYMVVAPGTYSNTQVVVTTNLYTYTLDASNAKTFTRSHVKPMNVNIQSGTKGALPVEETWTKVTSASDFTEGTYYILRSDGAYYVPNGTGNPSCSSYSGGAITNGMKWTATASGDGLIFESYSNAGYYLWTTNTGSANTISVAQSSSGQNASNVWSFASVSANNTTYYTATAGASKYLVSYGTSNWRYYASGNISNSNLPAEFYKRSVVDPRPAPGMSWSAESVTATYNTGNSLSFTAPTLTAGNATGITYSSSDETIATISDAGVVSVNLTDNVVKEGSTTISAIYTATDNGLYKSQTVSYTLTVADNRAAATTPTFDPAAGEVSANQVVTFKPTNESLTFHYTTNGSDPTIESPTAASVTIDAAKTVKVLATKTGYKPSAVATAAYTIAGAQANDGSLEYPYTVAEARAIVADLTNKTLPSSQVYVSGIVANVGSYNSNYSSVTYDISDDGQNSNTLRIYSGRYVANTGFSSNEQIAVADEVIVYGYLYKYDSTYEMYQDNYIYSLNGITKALTAGSLSTSTNASNKQITVTWGAATGTTSAISYVVNCGSQSYNASAAGSHTFTMSDYGTFNVSVVASATDAMPVTASTTATLTDPNAGERYYTKVTDLSTLSANDVVLIINPNHDALPAFTGTSTVSATDLHTSYYDSTNDRYSNADAAVNACAVTLIAPTTAINNKVVFKLKMSNNYYIVKTATSGTGFNPNTSSTAVSGDWTLTIESNGKVKIKHNLANATRCILWQAGSTNKFGAYAESNFSASGYSGVDLYKLN
ncbi:MAG: chitobiase/beta-hexosaminidase C-terminal domain-containing protein [Bacteroidales bacterium]|nr:chitobiase/beta-hexosaminidase C-terminal domain-containing protein [Bacteroidales bacterium]